MLRIRQTQWDRLEELALRRAPARLARYFAETFPERAEQLAPDLFERAVAAGIDRAMAHGLKSERDVCLYVTLMFMLGGGFDEDPLLPWAHQILTSGQDARIRTFRLGQRARAFLDDAEGKRDEHLKSALRRLVHDSLDELCPQVDAEPVIYVIERLRDFHPRACAVIGDEALERGALAAVERSERIGLATARGAALYAGMMLMLGSGFETDPLVPWASAMLERVTALGAADRAVALHTALAARARGAADG